MLSDLWSDLQYRVRALFRRRDAERDLADEVRFHLAREADKLVALGVAPDEARRQARLAFGGVEQTKEAARDARGVRWLEQLGQDLRYAVRGLKRSPGFAATAILVTALGVGANATAFSVTDFVLIRPLPFASPSRLVTLWEDGDGDQLSPSDYADWKAMSRSIVGMAAYTGVAANLVAPHRQPDRVQGAWVSHDLFSTLGVGPLIGRGFTVADDSAGARGTVVLAYTFWQSEFGGDRTIVGRELSLNGQSYDVIGVMPPSFQFPTRSVQLFMPFRFDHASDDYLDRTNNYLNVVARLKPGVRAAEAQSELATISARLVRLYPTPKRDAGAAVHGLRDQLLPQARLLLWALSGASLCILLIACANLGNLMLVRGVARRRELAVRTALGAGRARLVRQLITETALLVGAGWALGIGIGMAGVPLLARLVPDALPVGGVPTVDPRVLGLAGALTLITSLGFAVLPAWRASRRSGLAALRDGRGAGAGRQERSRGTLVALEVAASVVLLASAGLLLRAVVRIQDVNPGFSTSGVLTLRTALPSPTYAPVAAREQFYRNVLGGVRALPGVSNAAYISGLPMVWGGGIWAVTVKGDLPTPSASRSASLRFVTPGYFATMGITLIAGRDINTRDTQRSPYIAVVSASFIRRYWPNAVPIGQRFAMADGEREVVGVVADIKMRGLERSNEPQVYVPSPQVADSSLVGYWPRDLAIRTSATAGSLLPAIRRIVRGADPEQPVSNVQTIGEILAGQTASRAAQLRVLGALAVLAFLLAGVGVHGLLSLTVSQRSQEIGVRMALGAGRANVVAMILRRGTFLLAAGIVPGVVLAYVAGRSMQAVLFGVPPMDLTTYSAVIGLCFALGVAGCVPPAWRASRVDPARALRAD